jgi:hypothetical protein
MITTPPLQVSVFKDGCDLLGGEIVFSPRNHPILVDIHSI